MVSYGLMQPSLRLLIHILRRSGKVVFQEAAPAFSHTPLSHARAFLPNGRVPVRANQHKRNHTGLPAVIHPIVDCASLYKHITRLEMHHSIVHFHIDFARQHHRVINAVGPMITGCSTGLKFDDPEHGAIFDGGADLARPLIFAVFREMDR